MSIPIQSLLIPSYQSRTHPKPHTVYCISIQAHVRSWQMWRRYSEFDDLRRELEKEQGGTLPELPPKHPFKGIIPFGGGGKEDKMLEERREGLEKFLRAILSSKDERWRESYAFKEFLGVPTNSRLVPGGGSSSSNAMPHSGTVNSQSPFTLSTWLDEHTALQSQLRNVWASIHKRDALLSSHSSPSSGDISSAHKANVEAKTQLAGVLSRIGTLGRSLQDLAVNGGMSEGELQRRTDMVARLQDDCEKLGKVVAVARQAGLRAGAPGGGTGKTFASEADREQLLGGAASKPARRVFGAPASPPKETTITRPLDNHGLLSLQETQMKQQDDQLAQLTTILQRQRHLGEAINQEVAEQIEMLDDLGGEVDRVGGKLGSAKGRLNKLG